MKIGQLAQLDRVLASEAKGRGFESRIARQIKIKGLVDIFNQPFFCSLPPGSGYAEPAPVKITLPVNLKTDIRKQPPEIIPVDF